MAATLVVPTARHFTMQCANTVQCANLTVVERYVGRGIKQEWTSSGAAMT
ncbi:MAG: hypothetical protein FWH11_10160 [Micrococcales bacterium]|nr:hypothetical protein [Micrococcales bacterium]